jgi:dihydropteroate synthase
MKIKTLSNDIDIKSYLKNLDVDSGGVEILASKTKLFLIEIKDLHVGAGNILNQDALSGGADLAVPRGTIIAKTPKVDVLLIANKREIQKLYKKLQLQPFGLKEVASYLKRTIQVKEDSGVEIMGVINANDDSFFSKSRFVGDNAISAIEKMIENGAGIIDIGGVSSRPGSVGVSEDEEFQRIKPIADAIYNSKLFQKVKFSIDSYTPKVISYVLDKGFEIVNDITGFENDKVCKITAKYNAKAVVMHMQGTPQTMQENPTYDDVVLEVYEYLKNQKEKLNSFGVDDVILDVGIGFGKTLSHNIELIKNLSHFKTLSSPLLIGASRKSMIDKIFPSSIEDRLAGTLAVHLKAVQNGANILRVHDVYEHSQALRVFQSLS